MKLSKIIILLFLLLSFSEVKSQSDTLIVYPNPFADTLNIQIKLVSNDTVTILVYNVLGQNIKTLANDSVMSSGNHIIVYDTHSLTSGVYFVEMKIGGQTFVKKAIKPSTTNSIKTITANTSNVTIFPNPNNGNITLQSANELGLITICNTLGELVYSQTTKENNTQIDLSNQAPGIYFVKIQDQFIKLIKE
jgi:hypothetical protein